jgi:hypothetical protein
VTGRTTVYLRHRLYHEPTFLSNSAKNRPYWTMHYIHCPGPALRLPAEVATRRLVTARVGAWAARHRARNLHLQAAFCTYPAIPTTQQDGPPILPDRPRPSAFPHPSSYSLHPTIRSSSRASDRLANPRPSHRDTSDRARTNCEVGVRGRSPPPAV